MIPPLSRLSGFHMFRLTLTFISLIALGSLTGCAATTPLMVAGGGGHQMLNHQQNKKLRAAAALNEEPDLLTYSIKGIATNRTEDVVNVYLKGYTDAKYSQAMKSLAIYQIGLIYMNQFNEHRDDQRAMQYFKRHQIEFPDSLITPRIERHISILEARKLQPKQYTAKELLANVDAEALLNKPHIPYDEELTPMSERAISTDRIDDAHSVYMVVYENPASSDTVKAKSLYQLGLIYMSPYNRKASDSKALALFTRITREFPNSEMAKRASHRISEIHSRQAKL